MLKAIGSDGTRRALDIRRSARHTVIEVLAMACCVPAPAKAIVPTANAHTEPTRCGNWMVRYEAGHPSWPGHYYAEPADCMTEGKNATEMVTRRLLAADRSADWPAEQASSQAANQSTKQATWSVRAGDQVRLTSRNGSATTELLATALGDGAVGEMIRFRSSLGGSILWGRVKADASAELMLQVDADKRAGVGW